MTQPLWEQVDRYLGLLVGDDPAADALIASEQAGLPPINVTPSQGKLLKLLAAAIGARAILEIGTLGGYSTIWLASALPPDGRLVTLETNPLHAKVAGRILNAPVLAVSYRYASATRWKLCRSLPRKGRGPSISCSSTPTSRDCRTIFAGR